MQRDFLDKLGRFEDWAYSVSPHFGQDVSRTIRDAVNGNSSFGLGAGLLDSDPSGFVSKYYGAAVSLPQLETVTLPANETRDLDLTPIKNVATSISSSLSTLVNGIQRGYLDTMGAYYTAQGKVADLKLAAQGSAQTQAINTAKATATGLATAIPPAWFIMGGIGLVGLVLLTSKK